MVKEVAYICDPCREKPSNVTCKSKVFCRVSSLESSFVCAECSTPFSMGYKVTNKNGKIQENFSSHSENIECDEEHAHREETDKKKPKGLHKRPHTSLICHSTSENKDFLNQHKKIRKRFFKCKNCDKAFLKRFGLNQHLLTHSKERRYKCKICPLSFKHRSNFRSHKYVHKENFKCEICNKCFGNIGSLQLHRHKHSNDKPHKCNECSKFFKFTSSLRSHKILHNKNNPWTCELCKTNYTSKAHLREHMIKHSNDRPHKCNICSSEFKRKSTLNRHLKKHNNEDQS